MTLESIPSSNRKSSSSKGGDDGIHLEEVEQQNPGSLRTEKGGYAKLANFMARHPELAIFRRFSAIGTEALLCQQAQLASLESRLREVQAENRASSDGEGRFYDHSWDELGSSSELEPGDKRREQFSIINQIIHAKLIYGMESPKIVSPDSISHVINESEKKLSSLVDQTRPFSSTGRLSPCGGPIRGCWAI